MDQMDLTIKSNTVNGNMVKDMVLERLLKDEKISEDTYKTYLGNWKIIVIKKGWFRQILKKDKDAWFYKFVNFTFGDEYKSKENVSL